MADISAWSPVDESNTAAPPNGWPENMQVSGVNNCARAMMGAVRRFYDKLNDGSFVFNSITCGPINSTGNIHTAGTITSDLSITGGTVNSTGNMSAAGTITGASVSSTGNMSAAGTLTCGPITSTGSIACGPIDSTGNVHIAGTLTSDLSVTCGPITSTGSITCGPINSTGNIHTAGTITSDLAITGGTVSSTGNMSAAGTLTASVANVANAITAGQVTSSGNMSAAGTLTAGAANVTQTLTADHVTTNGIDVFGTINAYTVAVSGTASANLLNAAAYNLRGATFAFMDAGATYTQLSDPGGANITLYVNGNNSYQNNVHLFQSRGGFSSYAFFQSTGTYNQSGSWAVISDDRLKRNVEPYTAGLDALLRLTPRSFEYTERAPWPGRSYGLMASEVAGVVPEMVGEAEFDGVTTQTLAPSHAIFLLINACKELAARVAALEGALAHE
jgi:hypothetical protein